MIVGASGIEATGIWMGRVSKIAIHDRMIMRLVVSIVLLSAGLFVILSERYDPNSKHWAYATVGTILGFWLKGSR